MIGKVIKKSASIFVVNSNDIEYICSSRKKVKNNLSILVGDNVEFSSIDDSYVIENVYQRKNQLIRPNVANIDVLIIVQSVVEPSFNIFQLNKYLLFYEYENINNVIIYFSKIDLLLKEEYKKIMDIIEFYQKDNYKCLLSNDKFVIEKIKSMFDDTKIICFAGESGVGKSTLINKIIPNLNIQTNEISKSLNRGKHTTTTSNLIKYKKGYLVDTPGFGSIDLNISNEEIAKSYNDFREYSKFCKFSNCLHYKEKDCEVKRQVELKNIWIERYNSYIKILENNKYKERY